MTLQDDDGSLQNDARTRKQIDTDLTQLRSPGVPGYVYFLRSDDAIKIGFSVHPIKRVSELQIGNPEELELLCAVEGMERDEKRLHAEFVHLEIRNEWFRAKPELLNYIARLADRPDLAPDVEEPSPQHQERADKIKAMIGKLSRIRVAHGAETEVGYRCSNVMEQLVELLDYERPEWATDERQTLPYMIGKQTEALEQLRRAFQ